MCIKLKNKAFINLRSFPFNRIIRKKLFLVYSINHAAKYNIIQKSKCE